MRSVNRAILVGNLTRDPDVKETQNGKKIVTFSIATNREWVTQEWEKNSLAEFHNIAVWGKLADICEQYLRKGKLVYIEWYLKTRTWETEEWNRMARTEIVAQDMIMLNKKSDVDNVKKVSLVSDSDSESDSDVFTG